jgi:pyruvate,water dikinase
MVKPVPLKEAMEERVYGGKCASLGRALRTGLPTPDGFALGVELVKNIVNGDQSAIGEVSDLFCELSPAMAVRSSAVGEDSVEASFAGQHATVLNVMSIEAMLAAIKEVYDSAYTPEAMAYRHKMGITGEPAIAIALQKQILSDESGVMFTRNPLNGESERYIEASWGLGEAIVAGLVVPDSFRVSPVGEIVERTAGEKDIKLIADQYGNTIEVEVEPEKIEVLCLSDEQLLRLHKLASECEAVYGTGLDIEWAFFEDELYLLQCRGITR